jgi:hypothetical protein
MTHIQSTCLSQIFFGYTITLLVAHCIYIRISLADWNLNTHLYRHPFVAYLFIVTLNCVLVSVKIKRKKLWRCRRCPSKNNWTLTPLRVNPRSPVIVQQVRKLSVFHTNRRNVTVYTCLLPNTIMAKTSGRNLHTHIIKLMSVSKLFPCPSRSH